MIVGENYFLIGYNGNGGYDFIGYKGSGHRKYDLIGWLVMMAVSVGTMTCVGCL